MQLPDYNNYKNSSVSLCLRGEIRVGFSLHPITRFLSLVLPDWLSLFQYCPQAFLHILEVHEFVEVDVLGLLHGLVEGQADGASNDLFGHFKHGSAELADLRQNPINCLFKFRFRNNLVDESEP